jgi:hypothetical protein
MPAEPVDAPANPRIWWVYQIARVLSMAYLPLP